jgi:hypothetical protein
VRFIICVGNKSDHIRLGSFLSSIIRTLDGNSNIEKNYSEDRFRIVVINTGLKNEKINMMKRSYDSVDFVDVGEDRVVPPTEQMKMRMEIVRDICVDGDILCNFDDDYIFNPYWMKFARKIFEDNEQVHYLTLLKMIPGCGLVCNGHESERVKLSNFNFAMVKSAMGGSFMARWKYFKHHMSTFFSTYGNDNQYDGVFWDIVNRYYGRSHSIYMSYDFSLYQHCNLVSQYGHHWPHAYGTDFDPIVNPFEVPVE